MKGGSVESLATTTIDDDNRIAVTEGWEISFDVHVIRGGDTISEVSSPQDKSCWECMSTERNEKHDS